LFFECRQENFAKLFALRKNFYAEKLWEMIALISNVWLEQIAIASGRLATESESKKILFLYL
jgi:hypothetical protein